MAKTLWHAALRDLGPVTVTVKHEAKKSKFSKPDAPKPDYVGLAIKGEDWGYNVENQRCADFFKGRAGTTICIQAEGSRDDATILLLGQPGSQVAQPPPRQPAPADQPAAQPKPPAQPLTQPSRGPAPHDTAAPHDSAMFKACREFVARNRVLTVVALEAAWHTKREFEAAKHAAMSDATFTAVFSSMLYGAAQAGYKGEQPGLPLDIKFKVEPEAGR